MNPFDNPHLERQAAKGEALLVNAADLLAWRERMKRLTNHNNMLITEAVQVETWAQAAFVALEYINTIGPVSTPEWSTAELVVNAPAEVKS